MVVSYHRVRRWRFSLFLLCLCVFPVRANLLISELYYDAPGSDNGKVFVELWGTPGTVLTGISLVGVNGSNGAIYKTVNLTGVLPASGVFVVADDDGSGTTLVVAADLLAQADFQNGPDSVVLWDGAVALDALGYGDFSGLVFDGEGQPAPAVGEGQSLARRFAGFDTNNNLADFVVVAQPTPGQVPILAVASPDVADLLIVALFSFLLAARRSYQADTLYLQT